MLSHCAGGRLLCPPAKRGGAGGRAQRPLAAGVDSKGGGCEATLLLAKSVFEEILNAPDQEIPSRLLDDCAAIGVFPQIKMGGYILAAQFGEGVITYRDPSKNKWSPPAFFKMHGGSLGFQVGLQEIDLVLIFKNKESIESLLEKGYWVGVTADLTVGPFGREMGRGNPMKKEAPIYAYSRCGGLFVGVSLMGSKLTFDYSKNKLFYDEPLTKDMILINHEVQKIPNVAVQFLKAIEANN